MEILKSPLEEPGWATMGEALEMLERTWKRLQALQNTKSYEIHIESLTSLL